MASAFGLYRVHLGRVGEVGPASTVRVERSVNANVLPEVPPEPERNADVPEASTRPALVEAPEEPEPWPEEPEPAPPRP